MIEFSEEQKKVVLAAYDLICEHRFEKNEIEAIVFQGASIYNVVADKIYVLEDRIVTFNKNVERYFENKDVLEMLKNNKKRQEIINVIEKFKLQIKDSDNSKLLNDFDLVINIIKNLDEIVNKYERQFKMKEREKHANVTIANSNNDINYEINIIDSEPIISAEIFDEANMKHKLNEYK